MANHNKITIGRRFFRSKESLLLLPISWIPPSIFSQVKNDGSNVGETEDLTFTRAKLDLCLLTHFGTGDRVRVVFDGDMTLSAQGLCTSFKRQAIT